MKLNILESEFNCSRWTRDDIRNRSTTSRHTPSYHHSHSVSSNSTRANKMQSHILRRLANMRTTGTTATLCARNASHISNNNRSHASTIDRILYDQMTDLSSIPIDLTTGRN